MWAVLISSIIGVGFGLGFVSYLNDLYPYDGDDR